jgi:hypothetical protein
MLAHSSSVCATPLLCGCAVASHNHRYLQSQARTSIGSRKNID